MAYEALDSLQQTLLRICERDNDLTIRCVKQQIACIRDQAAALQFLQDFPEKEIIRDVANTTQAFSPQNLLAAGGSIDPTVRLSYQLEQLAEELESTVEDVVDYIRQWSDSSAVSSSSRSALESEVEDPVVATELIVINSNRLRRLAEKIMSTGKELPDEDPSDSPSITNKDVARLVLMMIRMTAAVASSSGPAPNDEDHLVSSNDDVVEIMDRLTDGPSSLQILPIILVGGIGESAIARHIYDHPLIMEHFHFRAWITITRDYSVTSILSRITSVKEKVDLVGRDLLTEITADDSSLDEIHRFLVRGRSLIVMDNVSSLEAWVFIWWAFPRHENGSRIILTTRLMDVATYVPSRGDILMMPFLDEGQSWRTTNKDLVVGFHKDMQQLMDRLVGDDNDNDDRLEIQILPIVGMGGIGKSTLAKTVYENPWIKHHFDIRGWVTISQDYSTASILSQVLASLKGKVDPVGRDSLKVTEADDIIEINKILSRRYLIVMDDMWSVEAWDSTQRLFPENYNGSKIILTTRLMDVATSIAPLSHVHMMRFMDDKQSWRLFQYKVFGDQDCPYELQSVGEKIVKGCGGLPLSIVTVAKLLSRIPRTPKLWQQIEANDGQLGSILSLSYNHLPPHSRECFLYMAAFPENYEIHTSELIKLWVAEGFLERHSEFKRVEEAAEECLEDLIKQSLVLVISRKSNGKIKSCRLHRMVRDFCARQAGQRNFLLPVMDYFPDPILRRHFLPQVLRKWPHKC